MNNQLRWITHLLDAHDILYWVDCGTLLGLKREGDLLKAGRKTPDSDIDIGMWSGQESRLRDVLPLVRQSGYVVRRYSYNGLIFKYILIPKLIDYSTHSPAFIDVGLFRKHGQYAWCPDSYPMSPDRFGMIRHFSAPVRDSLQAILSGWWKPEVRFISKWLTIELCAWPWRIFSNVGTNWVPQSYFTNLMRCKEFDVLMPREWEDYLEFRYGDWRTRVINWHYWMDDRAFRCKPPQDLIQSGDKTNRR